ncbi:MAG: DUF6265 family protein [Flavobacteriales bacterium]|nr:DUF6265 family protein [Flavobacteriales bacterium]
MKVWLLFLATALASSKASAQEVLSLAEGERPAKVSVMELGWLSGHWQGTGFGGLCDEVWLPPADNAMQGVFRLLNDGSTTLTEYMCIIETDTATLLRLKHFGRKLEPWEDRDKWLDFTLVKVEGHTAWFSGLTYHLKADTLIILLSMKEKERVWTEEFRLVKQP